MSDQEALARALKQQASGQSIGAMEAAYEGQTIADLERDFATAKQLEDYYARRPSFRAQEEANT